MSGASTRRHAGLPAGLRLVFAPVRIRETEWPHRSAPDAARLLPAALEPRRRRRGRGATQPVRDRGMFYSGPRGVLHRLRQRRRLDPRIKEYRARGSTWKQEWYARGPAVSVDARPFFGNASRSQPWARTTSSRGTRSQPSSRPRSASERGYASRRLGSCRQDRSAVRSCAAIALAPSLDATYGRTDWRGAAEVIGGTERPAGGRRHAVDESVALAPLLAGARRAGRRRRRVEEIAVVGLATEGGYSLLGAALPRAARRRHPETLGASGSPPSSDGLRSPSSATSPSARPRSRSRSSPPSR